MNRPAIELLKSELFLLGDAERIDDRLSWYSPDSYGRYVFYNSYLLRGGRESLLVESGGSTASSDDPETATRTSCGE
jgi:hypothetical protein